MRPLFALIPVALFLTLATAHCIRSGTQLEDSGYVVLRVADNLRQGNGLVFNLDTRRDLVDSPLWLGLLAVVGSSTYAPLAVQILGLVLGALALWLVLSAPRLPAAGACASLFLALDGLFATGATSGTSTMFAALYPLGLYAWLRGAGANGGAAPWRDKALCVWVAVAALVRYELVLVAVPVALAWGLGERRDPRRWLPLVVALASAVLCIGMRYAYFRQLPSYWEPWPPSLAGVASGVRELGGDALRRPLLVLGATVMFARWAHTRCRWGRDAGLIAGLVVLAGFALLPCAGHDVDRQLVVVLPLAYVLAVEALWRGTRTRFGLVTALLLVAAQPALTWTARTTHPQTRAAYARLGQWLGTHALPGTVVGARQVGALAYYSQLQVVDVLGQANPRVAAARRVREQRSLALAAADFGPMLRQEPDLVLSGDSDPVPTSILYVPNQDAVPKALRGKIGIYRWAGSPVWRSSRARTEDAASPAPTRLQPGAAR